MDHAQGGAQDMTVPAGRRAILAAAGALAATSARAQAAWPTRPVRFIVPFAAGSPVEIPARMIGEHLGPRYGQSFIVEARPGAGGALGIQHVAQATDGHTLLVTTSAVATLPAFGPAAGFDPLRDLAPISMILDVPMVILARADSPLRDFSALLERARREPGRITFGSSGTGSTTHLGGELLKVRAGIDLLHIPYRGAAQAVNALYSGDIDLMVTGLGETMRHIQNGRLRALAVTSAGRNDALPGIPAVGESVPDYAITIWYGMLAPRGFPAELVARIARDIAPLARGSALAERMQALGATLMLDGPGPLAARLAQEVPLWREVVARAGIRAE